MDIQKIARIINFTLIPVNFFTKCFGRAFEKLIGKDCVAYLQMMIFLFIVNLIIQGVVVGDASVIITGSFPLPPMFYFYVKHKQYVENNGYSTATSIVLHGWMVFALGLVLGTSTVFYLLLPVFTVSPKAQTFLLLVHYILASVTFVGCLNFSGPGKTIWSSLKDRKSTRLNMNSM